MIQNIEDIKDVEKLFHEIKISNNQLSDRKLNFIKDILYKIENYYKNEVKTMKIDELRNKINKLKKDIRKDPDNNEYHIKLISIMKRVNKIINGYKPRDIQIISILFFLYKEKNSGLIEEILTGEGKTIIISFLAILKTFQGKKVDVLTSSLVLAERDAKEMEKFYNFFGISVDYCKNYRNENSSNDEKLKNKECFDCYKADIVYGNCLSFESDILRTIFMGITGRGRNRSFDCIIIDEIDNICIDNIKNITELLDNFHGYKFLEYIYLFIYREIKNLDQNIIKETNYDKFKHDIFCFNFKEEIINNLLEKSQKEFGDLKLLSEKRQIYIPEHLQQFIKCRLKKWCEAAYEAFYVYKENKEYIISEDQRFGFKTIKPVDFSNTGVIKQNSEWTGLHQFLQIKEGLNLTEENLNSCYMSNFTFFKKYISINENNIYGLTGTLGTQKTQDAMKILYKLNLLFIPTFKKSKLKIEEPIIIKDKDEYKKELINTITNIVFAQNRSVLVIFKYIKNVIKMYDSLIQRGIKSENIIKYTRDDNNESDFLNRELPKNLIILSTNLSGRGTDIKISKELEENNGLHVILTFLPFSERIERQAFGRAGRKGEKGSGQLFINSQDDYSVLINRRIEDEENEFNYLINVYKKRIELFQDLFEEFTEFLNEIRRKKKLDETVLLDIKERWGLFLVENDLSNIEQKYKDKNSLIINERLLEQTKSNFKILMNNLRKNIENRYEYFNPLLLCKTFEEDRCNEAIDKSPIFCFGAYLFRTFYKIEHHDYFFRNKNDFELLENNCNIFLNQINVYINMMKELNINDNSDLYQQTLQKQQFFIYLSNLIKYNKDILKNYINESQPNTNLDLIPKIVYLDDINKNGEYNNEIMNYFKDYGMCLYNLEYGQRKENSNCNIF
jgi:preprotein translocase subunit SecA